MKKIILGILASIGVSLLFILFHFYLFIIVNFTKESNLLNYLLFVFVMIVPLFALHFFIGKKIKNISYKSYCYTVVPLIIYYLVVSFNNYIPDNIVNATVSNYKYNKYYNEQVSNTKKYNKFLETDDILYSAKHKEYEIIIYEEKGNLYLECNSHLGNYIYKLKKMDYEVERELEFIIDDKLKVYNGFHLLSINEKDYFDTWRYIISKPKKVKGKNTLKFEHKNINDILSSHFRTIQNGNSDNDNVVEENFDDPIISADEYTVSVNNSVITIKQNKDLGIEDFKNIDSEHFYCDGKQVLARVSKFSKDLDTSNIESVLSSHNECKKIEYNIKKYSKTLGRYMPCSNTIVLKKRDN